MDLERYRDNLDHPARKNKRNKEEPTRQPREGNRLYCIVWEDNDLFKVGLGSNKNARESSAIRSITRYFTYDKVIPGDRKEWRTDLPGLDRKAWGDCQRFEMVAATAIKTRLRAEAAGAVGLEWFFRKDLQDVSWEEELTAATHDALAFSALESEVDWTEYSSQRAGGSPGADPRLHGFSQRDAWRTKRNAHGQCALKDCGAALTDHAVPRDRFLYCSDVHATDDLAQRLPIS